MSIIEVKDTKTEKEFYKIPFKIYKNDPHWVPHLKQDLQKVFDSDKNKFFRHGELIRWIIKKDGETLGRIAAFVNEKKNKGSGDRLGGIGFF